MNHKIHHNSYLISRANILWRKVNADTVTSASTATTCLRILHQFWTVIPLSKNRWKKCFRLKIREIWQVNYYRHSSSLSSVFAIFTRKVGAEMANNATLSMNNKRSKLMQKLNMKMKHCRLHCCGANHAKIVCNPRRRLNRKQWHRLKAKWSHSSTNKSASRSFSRQTTKNPNLVPKQHQMKKLKKEMWIAR